MCYGTLLAIGLCYFCISLASISSKYEFMEERTRTNTVLKVPWLLLLNLSEWLQPAVNFFHSAMPSSIMPVPMQGRMFLHTDCGYGVVLCEDANSIVKNACLAEITKLLNILTYMAAATNKYFVFLSRPCCKTVSLKQLTGLKPGMSSKVVRSLSNSEFKILIVK